MSAALHKRESKIRTFFIKAALFVVALTMTAARIDAQTIPAGLRYERDGQSVTIIKYTGTATTLVIPDTIAGLAVTHLEYRAFVECTGLRSVTFVDGSGISALDFYDFYPFPGDLRNKYLAAAGGAGKYTLPNGSETWTKLADTDAATRPEPYFTGDGGKGKSIAILAPEYKEGRERRALTSSRWRKTPLSRTSIPIPPFACWIGKPLIGS